MGSNVLYASVNACEMCLFVPNGTLHGEIRADSHSFSAPLSHYMPSLVNYYSHRERGVPMSNDVVNTPMVCFFRYHDNNCLVLIGVTDHLLPFAEYVSEHFTNCVYRIPLKWEPNGPVATWGSWAHDLSCW